MSIFRFKTDRKFMNNYKERNKQTNIEHNFLQCTDILYKVFVENILLEWNIFPRQTCRANQNKHFCVS